jgi:hypothetical protein
MTRDQRFDPRAFLRREGREPAAAGVKHGAVRTSATIGLAIVGFAVSGGAIVHAQDDNGAINFLRSTVRTQQRTVAPTYYAPPRTVAPVIQIPQVFLPRSSAPQPRSQTQLLGYAPFGAMVRDDAPSVRLRQSGSVRGARVTIPVPSRVELREGGARVAYCVRTCDGFYFPLGATSASEREMEAHCTSLCPAAPTTVVTGGAGGDIETFRSLRGRAYGQMPNAFAYRRGLDSSCSCQPQGGAGVVHAPDVSRDPTLRNGDIVMTAEGLRVFRGAQGRGPHGAQSFAALSSSGLPTASRRNLQEVERVSITRRATSRRDRAAERNAERNEVQDLARAIRAVEHSVQSVRYVGPDRAALR